MEAIASEIRKEVPDLWRRARQGTQVGFPTSSGPGQIGGGCANSEGGVARIVANRVDQHPFSNRGDGQCECGASERHPDHHVVRDPVRDAWSQLYGLVETGRAALIDAQKALTRTLRPSPRFVDLDAGCCVSHLRIGVRVPMWEKGGGRCWWCWNERRVLGTGEDVWIERLRAYEDRRAEREKRKPDSGRV